MIPRYIKKDLIQHITQGKVVVLYGARQVGKSTLLKEILAETKDNYLFINGEDRFAHDWIGSRRVETYMTRLSGVELLVIDEAQKIPSIGLALKLIIDSIPSLEVIATGSSSFELANQIGEPLVGRKWQYELHPFALMELESVMTRFTLAQALEQHLLYGMFPEVITSQSRETKIEILHGLADGYLFRDILSLEGLRKPRVIVDLLRLLAFQIGGQVSINELAKGIKINVRTVERYLDVLEKMFIIKRLGAFAKNLRGEIVKSCKYYFCDNGIRNAVINNFNPLNSRNDTGMLWENFVVMERIKKLAYRKVHSNLFFWRTYEQKEIDLIEERGGKLYAFEIKYPPDKVKPPKSFMQAYPEAEFSVINSENYLNVLLPVRE